MNVQLIAGGARPYFFDAFALYRALKKLAQINVDIGKIKAVVISHDHWNHFGGLWELLEQRMRPDVYLPAQNNDQTK